MSLLPIGTRLMPLGIRKVSRRNSCRVSFDEILGDETHPLVITGYSKSKKRYHTNLDASFLSSVFKDSRGIPVDHVGVIKEVMAADNVEYHILVPDAEREAGFAQIKAAMQAHLKAHAEEIQAYLTTLTESAERLDATTSDILDEVYHVKMLSPEEAKANANGLQL